jgi:hypothetical protein
MEEEIVVSLEPKVVKGWPKVIDHGHIVEKESSMRLVLAIGVAKCQRADFQVFQTCMGHQRDL